MLGSSAGAPTRVVMEPDGSIAGDTSGDEAPLRRPLRTPTPRASPLSRKVRSLVATCFLDGEVIESGEKEKAWRGKVFHGQCFNAVRCAIRQCKTQRDKNVLVGSVDKDPQFFVDTVSPLVVEDGSSRKRAHLGAFNRKVEQRTSNFGTNQTVKRKLKLTRRRFKKFMKDNEDMRSSEAEEAFDNALDDQSSEMRDSEDEPRVYAKDNEAEDDIKGKVTSKDTIDRDRSRSPAASLATGLRPRALRDDLSAAEESVVGYRRARSDADSVGGRSSARSTTASDRRADSQKADILRSGPTDTRRPEAQHVEEANTRKCDRIDSSNKMVDVVKRKSELKTTLNAFLTEATSKASVKASLVELTAKCKEKNIEFADLAAEPGEHAAKMNKSIDELRKMREEVVSAKAHEIDAKIIKMDVMKSDFTRLETTAKEMKEAMEFMLNESRKTVRVSQLQKRYQVSKVASYLTQGGWVKSLAKWIAGQLHSGTSVKPITTNPDEFQHREVMLFHADAEKKFANTLTQKVETAMAGAKADEKMTILLAALQKKPQWGGSMMRADAIELQIDASHDDLQQDLSGGEPWVLTCRKASCRFGAHGFPLPGIGAVVAPVTDGCYLLLIECEPILKQGITLNDVMAFFESDNGISHLDSGSVKLVELQKGQVCWVPFGWMPVPLGWSTTDGCTEMTMVVLSYFHVAWWKDLPVNVRAAIVESNNRHLNKVKNQMVWTSRATLFDKVFGEPE